MSQHGKLGETVVAIIFVLAAIFLFIKSQYGLSDSQIDEMLDNFLSGKYSSEQYASALAELKNKGIEIKI